MIRQPDDVAGDDDGHQDRLIDLENAAVERHDCHTAKSYRAGQVLHRKYRRHAPNPDRARVGVLSPSLMEVSVTLEGPAQLDLDDVRAGIAYEGVRGDERHRVGELKRIPQGPSQRHARPGLREPGHDPLHPRGGAADRADRRPGSGRGRDRAAFNAVVPDPGRARRAALSRGRRPRRSRGGSGRLEGVEHAVFLEVAGARVRGVPEAVAPPGRARRRTTCASPSTPTSGPPSCREHRSRSGPTIPTSPCGPPRRGPAPGDRRRSLSDPGAPLSSTGREAAWLCRATSSYTAAVIAAVCSHV